MYADRSDHSEESQHQSTTNQSRPSWWEWCADPKVEAGILLLAMLTALITWGLIAR